MAVLPLRFLWRYVPVKAVIVFYWFYLPTVVIWFGSWCLNVLILCSEAIWAFLVICGLDMSTWKVICLVFAIFDWGLLLFGASWFDLKGFDCNLGILKWWKLIIYFRFGFRLNWLIGRNIQSKTSCEIVVLFFMSICTLYGRHFYSPLDSILTLIFIGWRFTVWGSWARSIHPRSAFADSGGTLCYLFFCQIKLIVSDGACLLFSLSVNILWTVVLHGISNQIKFITLSSFWSNVIDIHFLSLNLFLFFLLWSLLLLHLSVSSGF